jgi:3-dehydroquinate dehydratase/shikimate dehydrogenase
MQELYRYKNINKKTKIYAVIGNPIMHSFSPKIHNKGFIKSGINAVYLPIHIDRIEDYFTLAELLDIKGISITIPHKQSIIRHLENVDETVEKTGACNTLHKGNKKGWTGYNSDAWGFIEPLNSIFKKDSLSGKKITVVGAGGAARAIVYILQKKGASVLILNRTEEKAQKLAEDFNCSWGGLNSRGIEKAYDYNDIIVQTTNAGMYPDIHSDPFSDYSFTGKEIFYEIIYNPPVTKLMQRAINAGCKVISGKEMLINQALKQFYLFTGKQFPCKNEIEFGKY